LTDRSGARSIALRNRGKRDKPGKHKAPALEDRNEAFVSRSTHPTRRPAARVRGERPLTREQEALWEQAAAFCVRNLPTLWTAGEPRRESEGRWIVPIVLRYPDGYEGILGEMAWDEKPQAFTLLTAREVLSERARSIASSHHSHGANSPPPEAGT
jgi:hypothetical protein